MIGQGGFGKVYKVITSMVVSNVVIELCNRSAVALVQIDWNNGGYHLLSIRW